MADASPPVLKSLVAIMAASATPIALKTITKARTAMRAILNPLLFDTPPITVLTSLSMLGIRAPRGGTEEVLRAP